MMILNLISKISCNQKYFMTRNISGFEVSSNAAVTTAELKSWALMFESKAL
jgi:hypothetical protein